jgi:hypothetical protein
MKLNNWTTPGRADFEHALSNEEESTACVHCGDFNAAYRKHFLSTYGVNGGEYGRYSDAYRLGHDYAHQHAEEDWQAARPRLAEMWESRSQGPWDDFEEAVRFGWQSARK